MINSMCSLNKRLSFLLILSFTSFDLTGSIFLSWRATQEKKENSFSPKKIMVRSLGAAEKYFKRTFPLLCASILAVITAIQRGFKWGHEKKLSLKKRNFNDFMKPVSQGAKKMKEELQKNYQKNKDSWHAALGMSGIVLALFSLRNIRYILLRWGIKLNNKNLIRLSLAYRARGKAALHHAIETGNLHEALMLLDYIKEVDIPDDSGNTPLISAARGGYFDLVKCLVEKKADITKRTKEGETAITIAANAGNEKIADYLRNQLIRKIFNQNSENCPICLGKPKESGFHNCTVTPCCTNFVCHSELTEAVLRNGNCPVCRKQLAEHNS